MMPESDEGDYERRNREKFARERDYGSRREQFNMDRSRRDYPNNNGIGGIKRGFVNRRDDEPNFKRNRFEAASDSFEPSFVRKEENTTPVMLTFKKFLCTQDESLTDEEAIAKYKDYKLEFMRQECEKYFQAHKEEEWFRFKYHPEESKALKEEQKRFLDKRLEFFTAFLESGLIGQTSIDYENAANIIRLMDSVVIKLEGGTDEAVEAMKAEEIEDDSLVDLAKMREPIANKESSSNGDSASVKEEDTKKPPLEENGNASEKAEEANSNAEHEETAKTKKTQVHKTCSIFFKSIPASVKSSDLETLCKGFPGFLRMGLTDPISEMKFQRRGWITFRRDVNIKEIFWTLKNAKINGADLGAIVNRDLKRRIRPVNSVTLHRLVAQNDIRQASKLIVLYDHNANLFADAEASDSLEDLEAAIVQSKNPLLKNVIDYLVEEESAEEEELLGMNEKDESDVKFPLEVDKNMLQVLDKLIIYLRIVHSVDYYNHVDYPNEDMMPNRIGICHVRGLPPKDEAFGVGRSDSGVPLLSKTIVDNFINNFNESLSTTLFKNMKLSSEELEKLGKKDDEKAVEDFINANCVELAKEKWLCPLSGKKFKGPEFIRKHLQSKHEEKLNEIRDEVLYFNNFVIDPVRPQNTEPKAAPTPSPQVASSFPSTPLNQNVGLDERRGQSDYDNRSMPHRNNWQQSNDRGGMRYSGPPGGRAFVPGNRGGDFNNKPRFFDPTGDGRRDPRQQTSYRDLDAPEEIF